MLDATKAQRIAAWALRPEDTSDGGIEAAEERIAAEQTLAWLGDDSWAPSKARVKRLAEELRLARRLRSGGGPRSACVKTAGVATSDSGRVWNGR